MRMLQNSSNPSWLRERRGADERMRDACSSLGPVVMTLNPQALEAAAKALYGQFIACYIDQDFCSWDMLPDKQAWIERAEAAVPAYLAALKSPEASDATPQPETPDPHPA